MPERVLHVNDPLAAAIPRGSDDRVVVDDHGSDVSSIDESIHTAQLYEDVSADENFEEFNEEFLSMKLTSLRESTLTPYMLRKRRLMFRIAVLLDHVAARTSF